MSIGAVSSKPLFRVFDPRSVPRCALWYDAADSSTITLSSGSNIGIWSNKGSVLATLSQTTSNNQPTYVNVNGLSAVQFSGASQQFMATPCNLSGLVLMDPVSIQATSIPLEGFTAFAVVNVSQPSSTTDLFSGRISNSLSSFTSFRLLADSNQALLTQGLNPALTLCFGTMTYNTPTVLTFRLSGNNVQQCFINGVQQTTTNSGAFNAMGRGTLYSMLLGDTTENSNLSGYIHEFLLYNQGLPARGRQTIENYLLWKWNIIANVCASPITFYKAPPQQTLKNYYPFLSQSPILWFDATDRNTIVIDSNNKLIAWSSKYSSVIGAVCTISDAIGFAPDYSNFSNGMPAISLSRGLSQGMLMALGGTTTFGNSNATHCFVMELPSTSVGTECFLDCRGSNLFAGRIIQRTNATTIVYTAGSGGATASNTIGNNEYNAPLVVSVAESTNPNETRNLYVNGNLTNFAGTNSGSNSTISTLFFGCDFVPFVSTPPGANFATLRLGEWMMFSPALTRNNREIVEGYLAMKWGATISSGTCLNATGIAGATPGNSRCEHPYYRRVGNPIPMFAPALYSPDIFDNLVVWYDAADINTISITNGTFVQWRDKSICGNHLTISGGTYIDGGPTRPLAGNLPRIRELAGYSVSNSPIAAASSNTANIILLVNRYSTVNVATDGRATFFASAAASSNLTVTASQVGGGTRFIAGISGGVTYSLSSSNRPIVHALVNVSRILSYYANGNLIGATTTSGGFVGSAAPFVFGNNGTTAVETGELIAYKSSGISNYNWIVTQLEGYLAWKWGTRSFLPANHPYYLTPP